MLGLVLVASCGDEGGAEPSQRAEQIKADIDGEIRAATDKFVAEFEAAIAETEAARRAGRPPPQRPSPPSLEPWIPRYQAAAAEFAGTDDAVPFLVWLAAYGGQYDRNAGLAAMSTLTEQHAASAAMAEIGKHLAQQLPDSVGDDATQRLVTALRAHNRSADVRAWIAWLDHGPTLELAAVDSKEYREAVTALRQAAEQADDYQVARRILTLISKRESYERGTTAPNIEGVDLDGVAFKLSDYAGKVVYLDFWGDW